jgi:putative tricarboxylic transport membrane protein
VERFTFGVEYLWDGVHFAPALIGMFAVAEMIQLTVKGGSVVNAELRVPVSGFSAGLLETFRHPAALLRGSLIGTLLGVIPGIGGAVASFVSYSLTARLSKHPESFGKGNIEGVIATEAAINAKDGSTLIPTLALGIPGGAEMAVFMGILVLHGMQPGPQMLLDHQREIYGLVWALTAACIAASCLGLLLSRPLARLTGVDTQLLAPVVIAVAISGSYAIDRTPENVLVTLSFAAIGYAMLRFEFPRLPMVIAMVLGGIAERSFQQAMLMSDGSWTIFVARKQCVVLLFLVAAVLGAGRVKELVRYVRRRPRRDTW